MNETAALRVDMYSDVCKQEMILCVWFVIQERRKEFEANLERIGLELETEDKSVRC